MDNSINTHNWSLVQAFLAVAETGSLSEAARVLNLSQPTLGRQIKQFEATLQAELFIRHPRGFTLSDTGAKLLEPARQMQAAAKMMELAALGEDKRLSGTVRLTASEFVAHHILPPVLAQLRIDAPDIQITLLPSNTSENLLFREADIAVRMFETRQLDVVTKKLGGIKLGIFAAESYLTRKGAINSPDELTKHDIVGYHQNELIIRGMRQIGLPADESWFAVKCDDQTTYWELVCAGCGIGFSQAGVAARRAGVVQLLPEVEMPRLPVWLAIPEALRHTPRIRFVWDALEAELLKHVS